MSGGSQLGNLFRKRPWISDVRFESLVKFGEERKQFNKERADGVAAHISEMRQERNQGLIAMAFHWALFVRGVWAGLKGLTKAEAGDMACGIWPSQD